VAPVDAQESTTEESSSKGQDVQRIAIAVGSGAALGAMAGRSLQGAGRAPAPVPPPGLPP